MTQRVRIAGRFKKQSAEQLVTMAGPVIAGLTDNPAFPAPTVDLKAGKSIGENCSKWARQSLGKCAAIPVSSYRHRALLRYLGQARPRSLQGEL